eukprot:gb/GECG01011872.1/.p1 GENE.gb/GECG01011872.1/~~gb/GECG01011872.1/.p1  ORF type:complete len:145 (+),score=10.24 gb/GECG01011872.1/:1-435(+)
MLSYMEPQRFNEVFIFDSSACAVPKTYAQNDLSTATCQFLGRRRSSGEANPGTAFFLTEDYNTMRTLAKQKMRAVCIIAPRPWCQMSSIDSISKVKESKARLIEFFLTSPELYWHSLCELIEYKGVLSLHILPIWLYVDGQGTQ